MIIVLRFSKEKKTNRTILVYLVGPRTFRVVLF